MKGERGMRKNAVKAKLKNGQFGFGTMIKETLNLGIVDVLEIPGFDYFVIDMEHARYDMETIADILQYTRKSDITGVVRIPRLDYAYVAKALDMGAEGIWVPHVDTADEAGQLVSFGNTRPRASGARPCPSFALKSTGRPKARPPIIRGAMMRFCSSHRLKAPRPWAMSRTSRVPPALMSA